MGRAVLFAHLLLSPLVFSRATVEAFEYNKVALLLATAIVVAALVPRALAPDPRGLLRDPLTLGVLLFGLSAAVSTALSISPVISLVGAHESYFGLTTVLAYVVLYLATRHLCRTVDDARRLLLAPVVGSAVAATYALVQIGGLDPILYGRVSGLRGYVRPFATLGHPNFLSAYLAIALPVVVVALVRAWRRRQRALAAIVAVVAVLSCVAVAAAVSRGAWLALAAGLLVLVGGALAAGERRAAAAVGAVAAAALAVLAALAVVPGGGAVVAGLLQRLRQLGDSASRQHIWLAAWDLFRDHPLVGTGVDTLQIAFAEKRTVAYWLIEWNASPTRAHNEALNILATQGALGGAAVVVATVGLLVAARRPLRRAAGEDRLLVVALVAGAAAFAVQDLFSFTVAGCGTLAVTLAAVLARLGDGETPPAEGADRVEALAVTLVAAALAAIAAFGHNVGAAPLLDEPSRLLGAAALLAALVVAAAAVFALEQHGRPPAFAAASRRAPRPGPAAGTGALVARGVIAGGLVAGLVLRPLAAAWAAQEGVLLTPTAPAAAVQRLERAVALDPLMELYWVKLGSAAHAEGRAARDPEVRRRALDRARAAFERAIRLVPRNSYNYANLGRVLGDLARDGAVPAADALAQLDRALDLDPNNAYFYVDAANAALVMGDRAAARRYAARGAERYPRFALPAAVLGHVALVEQRQREAVTLLEQALGAQWHGADRARAIAGSNLAAAYLQLGKPEDAARAARAALERAPGYADARFNFAKALEGLGRRAEAIAEYRRLLADQPDYALARDALRALGGS